MELVDSVVRDVTKTTDVTLSWKVLPYDEWVRPTSDFDFFSLSLEDMPDDSDAADEEDASAEDDEMPFWVVELEGASWPVVLSDRALTMMDIASGAQDSVIDQLQSEWPRCPGHLHSTDPVVVGNDAAWVCPETKSVVAMVGELDA